MRRWGAVVSVISVCMLGCEQDLPEGVIARVGERDIDAQAFAVAARKVVGEDLALGSINAAGKRALLDIILARELLTLEGKRRGIDREEVVRRELDALERKLLSEELYQREIEAGLAVAEEEIEHQGVVPDRQ